MYAHAFEAQRTVTFEQSMVAIDTLLKATLGTITWIR
jgi:hypothetical protein